MAHIQRTWERLSSAYSACSRVERVFERVLVRVRVPTHPTRNSEALVHEEP